MISEYLSEATGCGRPRSTSRGGITASGVTGAEARDGAEAPAVFVAVTVNVTGVPSVRPETIAQWLGSSAVIV